mgnify:CR=1 FL=1
MKTNIETLPITNFKFPKVTVCPPKNTYTDLNYDLLMAKNAGYTIELKNDLIKQFGNILDNHIFMDDVTYLNEENRYSNWYKGLSNMRNLTSGRKDNKGGQRHDFETMATSGMVNTRSRNGKW